MLLRSTESKIKIFETVFNHWKVANDTLYYGQLCDEVEKHNNFLMITLVYKKFIYFFHCFKPDKVCFIDF